MDQRIYSFGETVLDWGKPVSRVYIVKQGEVRLRKPVIKFEDMTTLDKLEQRSPEEDTLPAHLYKDRMKKAVPSVEVGIREQNHAIAEEYLFLKGLSKYRITVSSAKCALVSIPFMNVRTTLSTYDMYMDNVRESILQRHMIEINLRSDIEARGHISRGVNRGQAEETKRDELVQMSERIKKIQGHRVQNIDGLTFEKDIPQKFDESILHGSVIKDIEIAHDGHRDVIRTIVNEKKSKEEADCLKYILKEKLKEKLTNKKQLLVLSQYPGANSLLQ